MPKENFVFRFFKFIILFFLTDLTAKNQPETTTKPDKQIPGTILSMKLHYNIQEFFQIKWLNAGFSRNNSNLSIILFVASRAQLSVIIVRYVFAKRTVYFCLVFYNPFFFHGNFAGKCCWKLFFYPFSGHYLCKKVGQNFLKCCKSNTTLPFVPYTKIKLI